MLVTSIFLSFYVLFLAGTHAPTSPLDFRKLDYQHLTSYGKKQVDCLAENIYFESAHEPESGKIAVALVTLNRVHSKNYPANICDVVHQKTRGSQGTVCQFSWVCDQKVMSRRLTVRDTELYNNTRDIAVKVFLNYEFMEDITRGAMFYHATYVNPEWGLPVTVRIGQHIFYRSKTTGERT
jgi:spore germination cell wall hydrolase CwlJ-like protein